jgi:RHS repeat-associated protein
MQNVQYKPSGAFLSATVGLDTANQWTESREYNSLLQARKLRLMKGAQKVLGLDWIYSANSQYNSSQDMYEETGTDNNGNLRMEKLAHTVGTPFSVDRSFGYDTANRLGSFTEPSKSQSFGYDAFGNLWQTAASGVPALRPNGSSWYLMASGNVTNRLANTAYDAAGHQTQLSLAPGTTASYDAEGRVSRVELNSSPVATYDYDADGRRVKKTVGATTTHYVYSADGQLMAEYGGTPASVGTQYLVADHLGSTRLILNAQGNCAERIDYAPFGAQLTRTGQPCYTSSTSGLPLFTGQIRDGESTAGTETGLDYFNARYFWATLGRFTSPDAPFADQFPDAPQSWNLYGYARNNPLAFIDPTGRCKKGVDSMYHDSEEGPCIAPGGTNITVTEKAPKERDPAAEAQAEMSRMQYEAWRRSQNRNKPKADHPIYGIQGQGTQILQAAGERAAHDVACVVPVSFGPSARLAGTTASARVLDAGFNLIPKGKAAGAFGSTTYTSEAAAWARINLPNIPGSWKGPVGIPFTNSFKMSPTTSSGMAGRVAPYLGAAGIVLGAGLTWNCLSSQ